MLFNRHSLSFRRAAWLALTAMLLSVLVPLLHDTVAHDHGMTPCAMRGAMDTADNDGSHQVPVKKLPDCPICQTLHALNNGFVAPAATTPVEIVRTAERIMPADDTLHNPDWITLSGWPRAPPFFA